MRVIGRSVRWRCLRSPTAARRVASGRSRQERAMATLLGIALAAERIMTPAGDWLLVQNDKEDWTTIMLVNAPNIGRRQQPAGPVQTNNIRLKG